MRASGRALVVLSILACAAGASAQRAGGRKLLRASLPGKDWALDVQLFDFKAPGERIDLPATGSVTIPIPWFPVGAETLSDDGREYLLMTVAGFDSKSSSDHARLEIRMKPARAGGGPEEFRDFALRELVKRETVKGHRPKTWEYNQIPIARYTILREHDADNGYTGPTPIVTSMPPAVEAYFVKDDTWITVTLSAPNLDADKEKLFYSLLDSVRFVDTSAPKTSFDYYHKGRMLFMVKQYQRAAELLTAALALERQQRELDDGAWRDLVAKLADSYGATNNKGAAKAVLEYAADADPSNTTFRMALARVYASMGDMDNTIAALRSAFSYMKKTPRAALPDLKNDPAFARYMKIAEFREAVKEMRK